MQNIFTVKEKEFYVRVGDMGWNRSLVLFMEPDGDIIVGIGRTLDNNIKGGYTTLLALDDESICGAPLYDDDKHATVEFCAICAGGGRSRHTRKALVDLMEAMKKDEKENPIPLATYQEWEDKLPINIKKKYRMD
jgi:hypothetical protein